MTDKVWSRPDFIGAFASGRDDISERGYAPDQGWFCTAEWQEKEAEADADIAAGRVLRHESDEAFPAALAEDAEED